MRKNNCCSVCFISALIPVATSIGLPGNAHAGRGGYVNPQAARVAAYWTEERRAEAIPRDLVIDPRGLGYLRKPDGSLRPYGHDISAEAASGQPIQFAKPGSGGGDTTEPTIEYMDPMDGATIGASYTFSATVRDASGIRSVSFVIGYPGGFTQSFNPTQSGTDTWTVTLQGFTDGDGWSWWVVAKDAAGKGGNTATSGAVNFMVDTSSGSPGGAGGDAGSDTVTNADWEEGGAVQTAAGRLYFEMPSNAKWKGPWTGYVCSGTVVEDDGVFRSIILTAAHCVYDDTNKAFARNVLFIPDQDGTTGSGTDLDCSNDPLGCWTPSFGVVDVNWTNRTFPDNVAWDYAYYVVADSGAHDPAGKNESSDVLDFAAGALPIDFLSLPFYDDGIAGADTADFTHALGYSYSDDPYLMYCAEDMTEESSVNWWLPSCGLTGGSSGGPWVQPMVEGSGSGPVISLNSWGYTGAPGMAGPKLYGTSAECVFERAKAESFPILPVADGEAGVTVTVTEASCP